MNGATTAKCCCLVVSLGVDRLCNNAAAHSFELVVNSSRKRATRGCFVFVCVSLWKASFGQTWMPRRDWQLSRLSGSSGPARPDQISHLIESDSLRANREKIEISAGTASKSNNNNREATRFQFVANLSHSLSLCVQFSATLPVKTEERPHFWFQLTGSHINGGRERARELY